MPFKISPGAPIPEFVSHRGGLSTGAQNDFSLFVGPKDIDILQKVNPKLGQIVGMPTTKLIRGFSFYPPRDEDPED